MDRKVVTAIVAALALGAGVNACSSSMAEPTTGAGQSAAMTTGTAPVAHVELMDKDGQSKGRATARPMGDGVHVTGELANVTPGTYAIHVHTTGTCTAPDFTSAGPHWNPEGKQHGKENPSGPHKGDLPNVTVGADGKAKVSAHISGVTMTGGTAALLDADGAALVLHAGVDDYKSDPTGNAGGRAACGVFKAGL